MYYTQSSTHYSGYHYAVFSMPNAAVSCRPKKDAIQSRPSQTPCHSLPSPHLISNSATQQQPAPKASAQQDSTAPAPPVPVSSAPSPHSSHTVSGTSRSASVPSSPFLQSPRASACPRRGTSLSSLERVCGSALVVYVGMRRLSGWVWRVGWA